MVHSRKGNVSVKTLWKHIPQSNRPITFGARQSPLYAILFGSRPNPTALSQPPPRAPLKREFLPVETSQAPHLWWISASS